MLTNDEISERLSVARKEPFKTRRRSVDSIIGDMIKSELLASPHYDVSKVVTHSPICGTGPGQLSVRPWLSSILLQTPLPVREGLIAHHLSGGKVGTSVFDVLQAILEPSKVGVTDTSTKTGYRFGWHTDFNQPDTEAWLWTHLEAKPLTPIATVTETPMALTPIDRVIDAHDRVFIYGRSNDMTIEQKILLTHGIIEYLRNHGLLDGEVHTTSDFTDARSLIECRGYDEPDVYDRTFAPLTGHIRDVVVEAIKHFTKHKEISMTTISTTSVAPAFDPTAMIKMVEPMLAMATGGTVTTFDDVKSLEARATALANENVTLHADLMAARKAAASAAATPMVVGEIKRGDETVGFPTGKLGIAKAKDVFNIKGKMAERFDFDVPMFEWDGPHPLVPSVDTDYVFEKKNLALALDALVAGDNTWVYGHTGSGKTTFVEQIAARLGWPLMRVNGDSDISRFELIGKTDFKDGETTFTPGALVTALEEGCLLLCDEFDVTRSETAYVLNRMLEMKGLLLLEDGGRFVAPHPMFRMVAACNSRGNGDEYGIYPAVRTQSAATRSRFTVFIEHDYLKAEQERELIIAKTNVAKDIADKWVRLANEVREAFKKGRILEVVSPREVLAACTRYQRLTVRLGDEKEALKMSVEAAVLARCSSADRAVVAEIVQRIFAVS
jgi:cobaltochelatase CobS